MSDLEDTYGTFADGINIKPTADANGLQLAGGKHIGIADIVKIFGRIQTYQAIVTMVPHYN